MANRGSSSKIISTTIAVAAIFIIIVGVFLSFAHNEGLLNSNGKSHKCISDSIEATVAEDGSLRVVDSRSYTFAGSYTLTTYTLDPPESGSAIINGMSIEDEDGTLTVLEEVEFEVLWRTTGGPSKDCYAIDTEYNTIYAFCAAADETKTFVFDYTYTNSLEQYADANVLYWQFIPSGWDVDTNNVTVSLTLPVPEDAEVSSGDNVLAFGHGGNGSSDISFADDGTIHFEASKVKSGNFAEMRVTFPVEWANNVSSAVSYDTEVLGEVIAEESEWQAQTHRQRILQALAAIVPLMLSAGIIITCIVLFRRFGKEHKPQFADDYWRDIPSKDLHPVVVGRLWRWGKASANDLTATLMHLSAAGVIGIDCTTATEKRLFGSQEQETYRLFKRDVSKLDNLTAIDREAIELVFGRIAGNADAVTIADIEAYAKNCPEDYTKALRSWQSCVDDEVKRRNLFESQGATCKTAFRITAVVLLIIGLLLLFVIENFMPLVGLLPGIIALFAFSGFMPRRSAEAVEVQARSEALKRWFEDFTALDNATAADTKIWGELLVYAYLFGVVEEVVAKLDNIAPETFDSPYFRHTRYWYHRPHGHMHMAPAISGDFFGRCFENSLNSANAAIMAAHSKSSGGFSGRGGGFSGGGGGGFGGQGGGFSR